MIFTEKSKLLGNFILLSPQLPINILVRNVVNWKRKHELIEFEQKQDNFWHLRVRNTKISNFRESLKSKQSDYLNLVEYQKFRFPADVNLWLTIDINTGNLYRGGHGLEASVRHPHWKKFLLEVVGLKLNEFDVYKTVRIPKI
jgi:hypothetical protein